MGLRPGGEGRYRHHLRPGPSPEYPTLVQAVKTRKVTEAEIDTAVIRLFTAALQAGHVRPARECALCDEFRSSENNTAEHRQAALDAARRSIVLLENDNHALPLASSVGTVAVIGPNAANLASIEGNYNGVPSAPRRPATRSGEVIWPAASGSSTHRNRSSTSELSAVVPRTVFGAGLKGEYFSNTDLSGFPSSHEPTRTSTSTGRALLRSTACPRPNTRSAGRAPFRRPAPATTSSLSITPTAIHARAATSTALSWTTQPALEGRRKGGQSRGNSFTIHFDTGQTHELRIEYAHDSPRRGGGVRLEWQPSTRTLLRDEAVSVAKQADVIVAFVGLSPDLEGEEMPVHVEGFSGGDHADIAPARHAAPATRSSVRNRKAPGCRAHEWQRLGRRLGAAACGGHPRSLVSGRRRRYRHRTNAGRREQSRRPPAYHVLCLR